MTITEVCEAFNAPRETVRGTVARLFPGRMRNGITTHLTEAEVFEVSKELKRAHNSDLPGTRQVAVTRLEMLEKAREVMMFLDLEVATLREQLEDQRTAVEFYEAVTDSKSAIGMSEAAKVLDLRDLYGRPVGRNKLFSFLRDSKILRKNNEPYQDYIDMEWFRVIEEKFKTPDGETRIYIRPLVYQKGLDGIRRRWERSVEA